MPASASIQTAAAPGNETDPVVSVASARFIVATETIPEGIRTRDVRAYLESIAEERSPLPLEHLCWGYLGEPLAPKKRSVLMYTAAREQAANAGRRTLPRQPILPGFAALYGLKVKEPTWVFLAETGSLSAVLIHPGQNAPSRVIARHLENADTGLLWNTRTRLIAEIRPNKGEILLPGIVRVAKIGHSPSAKRVEFSLQRQVTPDLAWETWQQTRLASGAVLDNADLREHAQLEAEKEQQRSGRSLRLAAALIVLIAIGIVSMELLLASRAGRADELVQNVKKQAADVEELKKMEAMTKALAATLEQRNRPFDLMAIAGEKRPAVIYFKSVSYDAGRLGMSGEADNIQSVNTYVAALRDSGNWAEVEVSEVRTEATGAATFQLRLKPRTDKTLTFIPAKPATPPPATNSEEPAAAGDNGATQPAAPAAEQPPQEALPEEEPTAIRTIRTGTSLLCRSSSADLPAAMPAVQTAETTASRLPQSAFYPSYSSFA